MQLLKMLILCILLVLPVTFCDAINSTERNKLQWNETHTVQVEELDLMTGFTRKYVYWGDKKNSRVDYNDGHKIILVVNGSHLSIYPKTTDYQLEVTTVCVNDTNEYGSPNQRVLPKTARFTNITGYVNIYDKTCAEFHDVDNDSRKKIWAYFSSELKSWVPVKFEKKIYNSFGDKKLHEIHLYSNFSTKFNINVFNILKKNKSISCEDEVSKMNDLDIAFKSFIKMHGKEYADDKEHAMRKNIYRENVKWITETNKKNLGFKLAINKFSDRTQKEMKTHRGFMRSSPKRVGNIPFPYTESELRKAKYLLPKNYDLRLLGFVSPVEDQGNCGSCYAFATTGVMEGALARLNGGRMLKLSQQALIDCSSVTGNAGCNGGTDDNVYDFIKAIGMPTVEDYSVYKMEEDICTFDVNDTRAYKIRGFTDVPHYNIDALKLAVIAHGPLTVSIRATDYFSHYSSGILSDLTCKSVSLNHEVMLVGYGETKGAGYWIIRNSYGAEWGMAGYIHVAMNHSCGITEEPTYVVI